MPTRVVKHTSGCVCKGVSRDDWHMGQQLRGKDPSSMWAAPSNRVGAQMEQKQGDSQCCVQTHCS
jgi:hypothetical protein